MKILIAGESCVDEFIYCQTSRLNPEAPTPVVVPNNIVRNFGMAANVVSHFQNLKIEFDFLTNLNQITKTRYVDETSNYILLRVDSGETSIKPLDTQVDFSKYDFTIISDYNKGLLTQDYLKYLIDNSKLAFLDTKKILGDWSKNAWVKINEKEYKQNILNNATINYEKTVITFGKKGAVYGSNMISPDKEIVARDVVGAGDTFHVFFALTFFQTQDIIHSIKNANHYAGLSCQKRGVASKFE